VTAKVVLATLGSLGDLHPFIAIAQALKQHGFDPTIATTPDFRADVLGEGIDFHPVGPDRARLLHDLRVDLRELGRRVTADMMFVLEGGVYPYLGRMYDDLSPVIADAALLLSSSLMFAARFAAEKQGVPHLTVALQPMVFLSDYDPPAIGTAPWVAPLAAKLGPLATRAVYGTAKALATRRARPLYEFRAALGLPRPKGHLLFEGQFSRQGTLAAYSKVLGSIQPDYPPRTTLTGFPFYDRASEDGPDVTPQLQSFLASGPPPLVFTLGTFAVGFPGEFYRVSRDVARQLGRRAVLLVGPRESDRVAALEEPDIFVADYVPHSRLFPLAAAVIHHGGIGTTGQALRSGRPQLVVPILSDQFDNAYRIARIGVGRSLRFSRYALPKVGSELSTLLAEPAYAKLAAAVGEQVRSEDGAEAAARVVEAAIGGRADPG
jgi:rhamnosyltransferase subunit B